jgi:hypothetical protein
MHKTYLFAAMVLVIGAGAFAQPNSSARLVEDQAAYLARCRSETVARYPNAAPQANSICQSIWSEIVASGPMADAILTAMPRQGVTFDPAAVRGALPSIRWAATPAQGSIASGRLGDIDVSVTRVPAPGLKFMWFKEGEPIPFNLEEALRVRGVSLTMIGCLAFGSAEGTRVYRAVTAGKSAFVLTIAARSAAVASQSSDFSATVDPSGRMPSLASLRADGSDWQASCLS